MSPTGIRGEIWLVNLDPTIGDEIRKVRPAIIVNRDALTVLSLRIVVPLTGWQERFNDSDWLVRVDPDSSNGLDKVSAADAFQVRSVLTLPRKQPSGSDDRAARSMVRYGDQLYGGDIVPSPLPGMNPYLEQEDVWHDFHKRFMPAAAEMLLPQVRPDYIVKLDHHEYLHKMSFNKRQEKGWSEAVDIDRQTFIAIRHHQTRQLAAVVELLSPSTKRPGADQDAYLADRLKFLRCGAHLVELDLLRGGPRPLIEDLPVAEYRVTMTRITVTRSTEQQSTILWPVHLVQPLPLITVPLRHPDPDAAFDLKAVLDRVYDAAGYEDYIYTGFPQPPLSDQDSRWATQFIPRTV